MPQIQMETVLFVFFAVALIFFIARLATSPVQMMLKLLMNSLLSVVLLCFISMIGEYWGIHLPINPVTVLIIAILGLPGLLLVSVLYFLMV
ncbi:MAG: pro-sigmaK processing inhibitor BofA family protein [Peptococcaceae bacterium]|nr:pro-sigmaK processing inhibitor BofA family protein [Peptococcaceae bacterium]